MNVVVFGVECQENVDYMLPLRNMVYEVGEYERQAQEIQRAVRDSGEKLTPGEYLYRFKKDSRLHPSITFILYYGKDDWDGARDLHGILDFTDIPETLQKLVQNFQIHLIEVRKLKDTSMFQTDVRQVFDLIRFSEDKDKLRELVQNDPSFQEMEEDAYDLAALYTKAEGLIGCKDNYRKGDKVDMCGAIEGLMEDARVEGREAGRAAGREEGRAEGRAVGRKEGVLSGRTAERMDTIRASLKEGLTVNQIKAICRCTEEDIRKAKEER